MAEPVSGFDAAVGGDDRVGLGNQERVVEAERLYVRRDLGDLLRAVDAGVAAIGL